MKNPKNKKAKSKQSAKTKSSTKPSTKPSKAPKEEIDFDELLTGGPDTYNTEVGEWWSQQSSDESHQKAYQNIARDAKAYFKKEDRKSPEILVDYACGNGAFILEALKAFPNTQIVAMDGSEKLLQKAKESLPKNVTCDFVEGSQAFSKAKKMPQVRLVHTFFPDFNLPKGKADLVFLNFPNLISDTEDVEVFNENGYGHPIDAEVARMLARFREMDPEDDLEIEEDQDELFDDYLTQRVYSKNLRHLLKKGGVLSRVDYTNADRHELTMLTQWRCAFTECSLEEPIKDFQSQLYFRLKTSKYRDSRVILDVYHQTNDPTDAEGGYVTNLFEAV